jgi:cytochrome c peroxidase
MSRMRVTRAHSLNRLRRSALPFLLVAAVAVEGRRPREARGNPGERIRATLTGGMDSLAASLDALDSAAHATPSSPTLVALRLRRARLSYKHVEGLLEYFDGMTATLVNARDVEASDPDDQQGGAPADPMTGFAVLDTLVAAPSSDGFLAISHHAMLMARSVRYSRSLVKHLTVGEPQLFQAARLELARIMTLGLGGYDARDVADRLPESAAALRGLRGAMAIGLAGASGAALRARRETDARFASAIARLDATAADDADVFGVIAVDLRHLARAITAERLARGIRLPETPGAWRASSDFIFDPGAFDPLVYAPGYGGDSGAAIAALGEALFFDPVLSGNGERACASCHHPDRAFTEDRARTATIDSVGRTTARNTPTLINAGNQPALFVDLRVRTLEDQVATVVSSSTEMRGNLDSAAATLSHNAERRRAFAKAFHATPGGAVTARQIQGALAAYVRSLVAVNARFDRAVRGDTLAITASERHGFDLFMGKARCGTCHFAPLFGGTLPPDYWSTPPEVIGVPAAPGQAVLDPDPGRGAIDREPAHQFAFKTPSLRNVAVTAPYMHNGVFATLEQVVDFYDRGGAAGLGINLPNQTLSRRTLGLTAIEKSDLVAFLKTLTDTGVGTPH